MNIEIKEGMVWPPKDIHTVKMNEHSCWYSGMPEMLADFYALNEIKDFTNATYPLLNTRNSFWGRMIRNNINFCIHIPIANDIAETSAAFLFGESPIVRNKATNKSTDVASDNVNVDTTQDELDKMLNETGFFQKILEGAETSSALGGAYLKLAWDSDISPWPIPLVVQADCAIPDFKFGFLVKVTFPYEYKKGETFYRLLETYEKGKITNVLYQGSSDNLGTPVPLTTIDETKELQDVVTFKVPDILARYIPNMLPNRNDRTSRLGRSDLQGLETMMDSLDETFSNWMREVQLAKGRITVPEDWLSTNDEGKTGLNIDQDIYVKLSVDPSALQGSPINVSQFLIHANELETTVLNLLDRIITSAGYSPQSFGLNIQGRAESGTALNVRERKSFATTNKKKKYWEQPLKDIIKDMCLLYNDQLSGKMNADINIELAFADGITNNMEAIATSVKTFNDAKAVSTFTKVSMIHPDWSEKQILEEVDKILNEGTSNMMLPPDGMENNDINQMKQQASDELGESDSNKTTIPGAKPPFKPGNLNK
jgi:A118 family predicted phage portal protein